MTTVQRNDRLIFLVEDDDDIAQDLALQIGHFGYTVRIFHHLDSLKREIYGCQPAAIVMDVVFPEGNLAGIEMIHQLKQEYPSTVPVMFISVRDDVVSRLQAVRAGGSAYFTKPLNVAALIDKLDSLTTCEQPEPYRVLIIDDDPDVCSFYACLLQQHNMITTCVNNPLQFSQALFEFRPDLILMDVYMPECNGLELASVIRLQETYDGIPIVFLSNETDIEKQLAAMHRGGDDFLSKSMQPEHLVSVLESRACRSRIVRASMMRDSLTGLLNHTEIKERLYREVLYARRRQSALAFAMVDIDHFKSVNDTYGHPTGDCVIKSLTRVLQQRLRKTDIIGRYGGEEFAIMLPDTSGPAGAHILDGIREDFSHVRHYSEHTDFSVTFSCGVADYPTFEDATVINKAADDALYQSKRNGRNQVCLAPARSRTFGLS